MALFVTLSRTGSVTAAAQTLGMSQPAASAMLGKLEDQLGFELFTRRRRRLELSVQGRSMLPGVLHALAALESVDRLAQSMGKSGYRRLVVGAVPSVGASILADAFRALQSARPEVASTLLSGTAFEVTDMDVEQRIDVGVMFGLASNEHIGIERLAGLDLFCLMRPDHPFAQLASLSIERLTSVPYIAHSRRLPLGAVMAQAIEQAGHAFQPCIEVTQFSAACAMVEAGCGLTVVESLTAIYAARHGLVAIPLQAQSELSLNIVWPLPTGLSTYAKLLVEELRSRQPWLIHHGAEV